MPFKLDKKIMKLRRACLDANDASEKAAQHAHNSLKCLRNQCTHELIAEASTLPELNAQYPSGTRLCEICGLREEGNGQTYSVLVGDRVRIVKTVEDMEAIEKLWDEDIHV